MAGCVRDVRAATSSIIYDDGDGDGDGVGGGGRYGAAASPPDGHIDRRADYPGGGDIVTCGDRRPGAMRPTEDAGRRRTKVASKEEETHREKTGRGCWRLVIRYCVRPRALVNCGNAGMLMRACSNLSLGFGA